VRAATHWLLTCTVASSLPSVRRSICTVAQVEP
jgi:hypothetical protein